MEGVRRARYNRHASNSKIRASMKFSVTQLLLCVSCALFAGVAGADRADRGKPINIEADALRYDDVNQTSVFTGRVVLTKGSILIRGHQLEVRQDPEGYQYGLVTAEPGKLASFRQKREDADEYIEGESETIEYDGRADVVRLIKNAQLRRLRGAELADEVTGGIINYNNATEVFTVDGALANSSGAGGGGRVRAMLTPKTDAPPPAAAPVAPATPALRPSTTLREERK